MYSLAKALCKEDKLSAFSGQLSARNRMTKALALLWAAQIMLLADSLLLTAERLRNTYLLV